MNMWKNICVNKLYTFFKIFYHNVAVTEQNKNRIKKIFRSNPVHRKCYKGYGGGFGRRRKIRECIYTLNGLRNLSVKLTIKRSLQKILYNIRKYIC